MADLKTKATGASVSSYVEAIPDAERRADCNTLIGLFSRITSHPAVMWGPSIVGFDSYHYRYGSGRTGTMAAAGFSSRKPELAIYLIGDISQESGLLAQLGKHKMGKSCLYVRRLGGIDLSVLEQLVEISYREIKVRYPGGD